MISPASRRYAVPCRTIPALRSAGTSAVCDRVGRRGFPPLYHGGEPSSEGDFARATDDGVAARDFTGMQFRDQRVQCLLSAVAGVRARSILLRVIRRWPNRERLGRGRSLSHRTPLRLNFGTAPPCGPGPTSTTSGWTARSRAYPTA